MNISKIDLFPVKRTEEIETRHASVYMSIDSYEKNVSISDGINTLNIVIDQEKMMRAFLYSLGNVRCKYDDAKREFSNLVTTRTNQLQKPLDKIDNITNLVEDSEKTNRLEGQQRF